MTTDRALLFLMQATSASFPSGAYAHSSGFETWVDSGEVHDAESLWDRLLPWLRLNLVPLEGAAVRLAHDAARRREPDTVKQLCEVVSALKANREAHDASVMTGDAIRLVISDAFGEELADPHGLLDADCTPHACVVFGVVSQAQGVARDSAVLAHVRAAVANLVEVVARLVPIGQHDVQRTMANVHPRVLHAVHELAVESVDDIWSMSPAADIASMNHERITTRLCIS